MPAAALPVASGQELPYPAEAPTRRLLEGLALLALNRADEAVRAFTRRYWPRRTQRGHAAGPERSP